MHAYIFNCVYTEYVIGVRKEVLALIVWCRRGFNHDRQSNKFNILLENVANCFIISMQATGSY